MVQEIPETEPNFPVEDWYVDDCLDVAAPQRKMT
jgi:hypothetical protein